MHPFRIDDNPGQTRRKIVSSRFKTNINRQFIRIFDVLFSNPDQETFKSEIDKLI